MAEVAGVGVDIVSLEKIARLLGHDRRELALVFTPAELQNGDEGRDASSLAGCWAAKEAVLKALGCGWSGIRWNEVEITADAAGGVLVKLRGGAAQVAGRRCIGQIHAAMECGEAYAVAWAVALAEEKTPA